MGTQGFGKAIRQIDRELPDEIEDSFEQWAESSAQAIQASARKHVSTQNTIWSGNLWRSIRISRHIGKDDWWRDERAMPNTIVSRAVATVGAAYAGYVEFGTGIRASADAPVSMGAFSTMEMGYKSPDKPPYHSIRNWVFTKPTFIGERTEMTAWLIARKIAAEGTYPHPFMRPAWFENERAIRSTAGGALRKAVRSI